MEAKKKFNMYKLSEEDGPLTFKNSKRNSRQKFPASYCNVNGRDHVAMKMRMRMRVILVKMKCFLKKKWTVMT